MLTNIRFVLTLQYRLLYGRTGCVDNLPDFRFMEKLEKKENDHDCCAKVCSASYCRTDWRTSCVGRVRSERSTRDRQLFNSRTRKASGDVSPYWQSHQPQLAAEFPYYPVWRLSFRLSPPHRSEPRRTRRLCRQFCHARLQSVGQPPSHPFS